LQIFDFSGYWVVSLKSFKLLGISSLDCPCKDTPVNNSPEKNVFESSVSENEIAWAAIQMLEHWERCGCDRIMVGNEITSQDWPLAGVVSKAHTSIQTPTLQPVQQASTIDRTSKNAPADPPAQSIPDSSSPATVPSTTRAPLPSLPIPERRASPTPAGSVTVPGSTAPQRWMTASYSEEQRSKSLAVLQAEVASCSRCSELACTRKQTVFGVGAVKPRVVFFGEAPGADEDRMGIPFVGAAGQLLNKILAASQMHRDDVYILNSLKCRPPANRTPTDAEIENCRPYFEAQLELLQPEFIVCLGAVAVRAVLKSTEPVGRLRGRFHRFRGAQVLVTYHPAYLLRNEDAKRLTWADMQLLMKTMGLKLPSS
jgi:uracil-DNA glycosylase family 4